MFIEQIIEFKLRGPRPPNRTCAPKSAYFYDKTKISKAHTQVIIFTAKHIAGSNNQAMYLNSSTWTKSLVQNLTHC